MKNMKKFTIFHMLFLSTLFLSTQSFAQKKFPATFYKGDWDFEVKDVPQGELTGVLNFTHNGSSLSSYFVSDNNGDTIRVDKINLADTSITLFFSAMGQDIELTLRPEDEQHITGTVMDTYPLLAARRKGKHI